MNCDCEVNEATAKLGRCKGAFWLWPDIARILNGLRRRWDKTRAKIFFFFSLQTFANEKKVPEKIFFQVIPHIIIIIFIIFLSFRFLSLFYYKLIFDDNYFINIFWFDTFIKYFIFIEICLT